ncbi:YqgE/AlgH family protein [Terasakiispira papahanaumokuakeensis]|nr:YqgE/AlgH family protein [Terasakiispira papahanaumokuakeensis]
MDSLCDHFLLAMPQMQDSNFSQTLTYLCEHNDQGAMGIVVNQTMPLQLGEVLDQLNIEADRCLHRDMQVLKGGPVHSDRGFVLHDGGSHWKSSMTVTESLSMTTSLDILEAIGRNQGPQRFIIALGCAGWEAGQLEKELMENTWLTCPAWESALFDLPLEHRLDAAAQRLGVELSLLSGQIGHA